MQHSQKSYTNKKGDRIIQVEMRSLKALATELNVHPTSISRLRTQDVLPEIGGEVLGRLIDGINKLTIEGYGDCTLEELTELVSE